MRIGILGGTFDPIHNGHLAIADVARTRANIDRMLFIPNRTPPHKPAPFASEQHRVAMLELALAATPADTWSNIELQRTGPSYTIDTLRALATPSQQLVLILGSDAAALLPQWYQAHALGAYCEVVVLSRHGTPFAHQSICHTLPNLTLHMIEWAGMDVSSSAIRMRCQRRASIHQYVPASVADYIAHHELYRSVE
ncbi:MAG: nicotinate-nucleotide adenylyltransferase [Roseiflexaceae bacterium]